ncbi:Alanyl-tRNA synthetase [hydrothermal vent metagenome]|uniref:Alanine--tRNA ligase n=1 Tax=hydrothermal vent metagenome TaxID=652676 RepID=A0A3B1D5V9_9ZZZZ
MTSREIRDQFFEFFKEKEHRIIPSAPVVPYDDPTLLFTNAGMNQFKDVFLGKGHRDYNRAANTQKCIRVSGKHNDLEEVGRDTYHHTFFEMLGNWSLGDPAKPNEGYYKKEAITWAWELLTDIWKLPKERLWATVYRTDDESYDIWKEKTDIDPKHILRFDEKDNFWEMGETGPCGPCSEIHINIGDDYNNPKWVNAGVEECIEIWNLVFIQYNRDENGTLHDLPAKHVDTGMGFERIVAMLQNKSSNYDTDIFMPLINKISELAGFKEKGDKERVAVQVIADHIRTLTFAIADGATPGNEGRGYVLRRILRRAARFGRNLNFTEPFLYKLVDVLVDTMSDVFPEIKTNQESVKKIIRAEEVNFNVTLDRGIHQFNEIALKAINNANYKEEYIIIVRSDQRISVNTKPKVGTQYKNISDYRIENWSSEETQKYLTKKPIISGDEVFKLYDTYGFPVDLTNVMAQEKGMAIDEDRFNELMKEQKERARSSTKNKIAEAGITVESLDGFEGDTSQTTEFTGYNEISTKTKIIAIKEIDKNILLIFDKTPFYAESGGQIDDLGTLQIGDKTFDIIDVAKIENKIVHVIDNPDNIKFEIGSTVKLSVDETRRNDIIRNHSATHLMNAALRQVLGENVQQSGSYVGPDRLRFDFTHYQKLTDEELQKIEDIVNEKISEHIERIRHADTPFDEAKKMGALMFFGDKYGDKVNVIQFGDFSMEFCGGTHVNNTSDIKYFKIVSESSIASGVRRIEAVTGRGVAKYIEELENKVSELTSKIGETASEIKSIQSRISDLSSEAKYEINEDSQIAISIQTEDIAKVKQSLSKNEDADIQVVKNVITELENNISILSSKLSDLNEEKRKLEKKLSELELKSKLGGIDSIIKSPVEISGIKLFKGKVDASNMDELKSMGDELRNNMKSGIGVLISAFDEKVGIVCVVSDDLIKEKKLMAGKIVGSIAKIVGGGGGGRPHLATAGGRDVSKIDEALNETGEIIKGLLS